MPYARGSYEPVGSHESAGGAPGHLGQLHGVDPAGHALHGHEAR